MSQNKKLKPYQVLAVLIGSTSLMLLLSYGLIVHQKKTKKNRYESPEYSIQHISQMGPIKEALKTIHLVELLGLSTDHCTNLYQLDELQSKQKLLNSGVISQVNLRKKPPNLLEIDYEIRRPIAYLADYSNTLVDDQGVIFPLSPYFTPKILPSFYLGVKIDPFTYGKVTHEKMRMALNVYDYLIKTALGNGVVVDKIDVSKMTAESLGQREIVLTLYETLGHEDYVRYLRLSVNNYKEELKHFLDLNAMNHPQNIAVDLRLFPNVYLTPLEYK